MGGLVWFIGDYRYSNSQGHIEGGDYGDDEMSVSLVEELGAPRGNHRPMESKV